MSRVPADDDDPLVWRRFTTGIRPLRNRPAAPPAGASAVASSLPPVAPGAGKANQALTQCPPPRPAAALAPADLDTGPGGGLDLRTLQRLKRGRMAPERRVDLHFMTQDVAHAALSRFLATSQEAGSRCVLVITGKGYRSGSTAGVLRAAVPRWLAEPPNRDRVLAFARAATIHGGEGALYVLLRRLRRPPA